MASLQILSVSLKRWTPTPERNRPPLTGRQTSLKSPLECYRVTLWPTSFSLYSWIMHWGKPWTARGPGIHAYSTQIKTSSQGGASRPWLCWRHSSPSESINLGSWVDSSAKDIAVRKALAWKALNGISKIWTRHNVRSNSRHPMS